MYNKKVMEMFRNPKFAGEIKNPSGKGRVGNAKCGDIMDIFIKVKEENNKEIIKDIKFKTFGCVAAIASTEGLCALAKGKTLDEALKITKQDIVDYMGGDVPAVKLHCSILASDGLKKAIKDYKNKKA